MVFESVNLLSATPDCGEEAWTVLENRRRNRRRHNATPYRSNNGAKQSPTKTTTTTPVTLWFDGARPRSYKHTQSDFKSQLQSKGEFFSSKSFSNYWREEVWNMRPLTTYRCFLKGISPLWEEQVNTEGGKWTIVVKKGMSSDLLQSLITFLVEGGDIKYKGIHRRRNEKSNYSATMRSQLRELICGVVFAVRHKHDIVSVWTRSGAPIEQLQLLGDMLGDKTDLYDWEFYLHKYSLSKHLWKQNRGERQRHARFSLGERSTSISSLSSESYSPVRSDDGSSVDESSSSSSSPSLSGESEHLSPESDEAIATTVSSLFGESKYEHVTPLTCCDSPDYCPSDGQRSHSSSCGDDIPIESDASPTSEVLSDESSTDSEAWPFSTDHHSLAKGSIRLETAPTNRLSLSSILSDSRTILGALASTAALSVLSIVTTPDTENLM